MSGAVFTIWFSITLSLLVQCHCAQDHDCTVLLSEPWPQYIFVPQESVVIINCTADSEQSFWSIELANDSTGTQHQFNSRQDLLNDHGVYELPLIETPGMPPTLRLLINDTTGNNQTKIHCYSATSISTTLFTIDPIPLALEEFAMSKNIINISWSHLLSSSLSPASLVAQSVYYNLTITQLQGSSSQEISLNKTNYSFTLPKDAPTCEVYNFSVTAAYVGAIYTGASCSDEHSETLIFQKNPDKIWSNVCLLGELVLNITVEEACTLVTYTLEPSEDSINYLTSNERDLNYTLFSLSINTTREGISSYNIQFYITKVSNEYDIIKEMNVAFLCNAHFLNCTLMLRSAYCDVLMKLTGDDNNNEINYSCDKRNNIDEEELNFTIGDELHNQSKVITRNFSINSACPSDDYDIIITATKHWIAATVTIAVVLSLFGIIIIATLGVGKIRQNKINSGQRTTAIPSEYQLENGEQNDYQEVVEAQTIMQQQEVAPVYDHVNLNSVHEVGVGPARDEDGYNTTLHMIQQRSANYERKENGVENYAKLQNDENHYYHTLERDRDPRGIEVNANIDSSPDNN